MHFVIMSDMKDHNPFSGRRTNDCCDATTCNERGITFPFVSHETLLNFVPERGENSIGKEEHSLILLTLRQHIICLLSLKQTEASPLSWSVMILMKLRT